MAAFDPTRLDRLRARIDRHVEDGNAGAVAWGVARDGEVHVGTAGDPSVERDTPFRIASMTKPMAAVAALQLVEEGRLRLDDPVDGLLPELADRRVLVDPNGPVDGPTVPAERAITVDDVLTFRLGFGMDFEAPWPQPFLEACDALDLGQGGSSKGERPAPDEWMRRLGTLPLMRQPGERWLYNTGYDVLGVLIARSDDRPLDEALRARVFEPLGMHATVFPGAPAFPQAAGGLDSTVDDVLAFGQMLLAGGGELLARTTVAAMTTDQLRPDQGGPSPDGASGWGYGVGVARRRNGTERGIGSYGWDGGLGTSWANDPAERLVATILTDREFDGPYLAPALIRDFWTMAYAALT